MSLRNRTLLTLGAAWAQVQGWTHVGTHVFQNQFHGQSNNLIVLDIISSTSQFLVYLATRGATLTTWNLFANWSFWVNNIGWRRPTYEPSLCLACQGRNLCRGGRGRHWASALIWLFRVSAPCQVHKSLPHRSCLRFSTSPNLQFDTYREWDQHALQAPCKGVWQALLSLEPPTLEPDRKLLKL